MTARRFSSSLAGAVLFACILAGCAAEPTADPTPAASTPPTETPTPTPTPTTAAIAPTCENTSTAEFQAMMAGNEWVSWTLPRDGIGATPFEAIPGGPPAGQITCRWGADPDLATDNITDLAWAPIADPDIAAEAQDALVAAGFERIQAPEGVYLAMKGEPGWADAEGYAQTYLFTDSDVRWAMFKDEVQHVKAPDEGG